MKTKIFFLCINIIAVFISSSAQVPAEKTLLWEVSGKGITKPSYLFGTVHLMCPSDFEMTQTMKDAFNSTQLLFLEMDMDDPSMMKEMMSGMMMKDATTLPGLLGNKYDTVSKIFKELSGMPLQMMNTYKPLMVAAIVYPALLGCTPISWESEFQKLAKEKGREIRGLETIQDQMSIFEKIPYKLQSELLVQMLMNIDSSKTELKNLMQMYKNKDINALTILTTLDKSFRQYEDVLLYNRNRDWVPIITEQAKKTPTFFAFGAGHLGGENGVISLLRKQGYKVEPRF